MRFFTRYRTNEQWFEEQEEMEKNPKLRFFDRTASNIFRKRGVSVGDYLYLVTTISGRFYVAGKMEVGEILSLDEATRRFPERRFFHVSDQILASRVTALDYTREVPLSMTARLLFYKAGRLSTLKFSKPGWLDSQTLRGIREMPRETAEKLDELLPLMDLVEN
jgi:hypothetical protein